MATLKSDKFVLRETPAQTVSPVTKRVIELPASPKERRAVRYRLARIMNNNDENDIDLRVSIEAQFVGEMEWSNFMQLWDVSETDPLTVVGLG